MTLLHIDSSILGEASVSRRLSARIVARLTEANPSIQVVHRDLGASPLGHLSGATLMAARNPGGEHAPEVAADLGASGATLQEFMAAETVVIGFGLYNFAIPSQLKAWVDRIVIAGVTFRYGENGQPVGLAGGKRVILAIARGGYYGPGSPAAAYEHGESYLRAVFGFMGVTTIETVLAEGVAVGPEQREAALAAAEQSIAAMAA